MTEKRTLSDRIKNTKLRAEREHYRVHPRRSPRGHRATRAHDRDRRRFWRTKTRDEIFFIHKRGKFYRVSPAGYLVQDFRAACVPDITG